MTPDIVRAPIVICCTAYRIPCCSVVGRSLLVAFAGSRGQRSARRTRLRIGEQLNSLLVVENVRAEYSPSNFDQTPNSQDIMKL